MTSSAISGPRRMAMYPWTIRCQPAINSPISTPTCWSSPFAIALRRAARRPASRLSCREKSSGVKETCLITGLAAPDITSHWSDLSV